VFVAVFVAVAQADGPVNGTCPVMMACSTLYISTGGVILGPGVASPPPPAVKAAVLSPTTSDTAPNTR